MGLVGFLIGMVASMFIVGGRTKGLLWSMGMGAATYAISGAVVQELGGSVLLGWVIAIGASSLVLTTYILWRNARSGARRYIPGTAVSGAGLEGGDASTGIGSAKSVVPPEAQPSSH